MKSIYFILATLVAVSFAGVASAQTKAEVLSKFNEAAEKYNAKAYSEAIPLFKETIEMTETSEDDVLDILENSQKFLANSNFQGGLAAARSSQFDEALAMFTEAKTLASNSGDVAMEAKADGMIGNVYSAQGAAALKGGDAAAAADLFMKAYTANNKNTKAGLSAAQCYDKAGDLDKASEIYKEIIALESLHSKYAEPAAQAKKAFSSSYLVAASQAATSNDYDGAIASIDKILEVIPGDAQALLLRVQIANNLKKTDDVIKYADEAAEAQTDDTAKSNIYFFLGSAYQVKENKAKAIESYQKVTAGDNVATAKEMITALNK